jgi:hypothetical protein
MTHRLISPANFPCLAPPAGRPALDVPNRTGHLLDPAVAVLVEQIARDNPGWGYKRIQREMHGLGYRISASTIRRIIQRLGIPPAPVRREPTTR